MTNIDFAILDFIKNTFGCGFMDFIMPKITSLGNGGFIWILSAVCLMFSKKYRKSGIVLIISLAVGAVLGSIILKPLIARPRPCHVYGELPLLINIPTDFSFPSGHTMSSVSAAYVLTSANKKFGYIAILLASLISFSRIYLYVHFPSDVIAGAIFGIVIAYFSVKSFYKSSR